MFYDFTLNDSGDIVFKQSERQSEALEFEFFTAKTNGLMFNFYIDNYDTQEYLADLDPHFVMDFRISNPAYNKEIKCIKEQEEYIYQQIKIRLSSSLGTIKGNEIIGSEIDRYKHMLLNPDKENQYTELITCVKNAIYDILPNAEVTVSNTASIYTDFTNSIIITISQDDLNYYYYL